jgi:NADPH2:quinone reductase
MEAAPINPSDLGVMFAGADLTTVAEIEGGVQARLSAGAQAGAKRRVGLGIAVGNEGAGTVISAGSGDAARLLIGKTVALRGGAMYADFRHVAASDCLVLDDQTSPREGASCYVNPLTALGMVETMRAEGHRALIHTAAASNLGQMLQKICTADGVALVNIVRKAEQADLMRSVGATYVCDSSSERFQGDLIDALEQSGATLGFDATGGGRLTSQILAAMEEASSRGAEGYSRYGSTVHKQVYVYGSLEPGPTVLDRTYGMAWGVGGWLRTNFLAEAGPEKAQALKARVAAEIKTTFASSYTAVVSLEEALSPAAIGVYGKRATGKKYLIDPTL